MADAPVGAIVAFWELPGVDEPHDMAIVASPVRLAGAERPIAILVGETRPKESRLHKFILLPEGARTMLPADVQIFSLCGNTLFGGVMVTPSPALGMPCSANKNATFHQKCHVSPCRQFCMRILTGGVIACRTPMVDRDLLRIHRRGSGSDRRAAGKRAHAVAARAGHASRSRRADWGASAAGRHVGREGCRSGRERWEEQLCWRHEPGEGDAWLHELGCQLRCMGLHAPGKVSPFAVGPPRLHAGACVQARVLHRCACQQVITACTPVQVLLYGLPLTALVGVAALALWNLSGPPVRPGSSVPGSPFAAKAHTSPLHFGRR